MKQLWEVPLPKNRFLRGIYLLIQRYYQHDVARESAALAYYLLFTLFPFLIFLSSLLGLLHLDITGILAGLAEVMPRDVLEFIEVYLTYVSETSSPQMMVFGLVFSVYFPMRATNSLMRSVRKAYHLGPPAHAVRHMLKTLLYTVFLFLTIGAALILLVVSRSVLLFLVEHVALPRLVADLWTALRFPAIAVLMSFALCLLYAMAQDRRQPARNILPGVCGSLTVWLVLSAGFSFYVENFANYSVIYGSIGAVIVLMIWLYMSATTLVIGAEFNGMLISLRKESGETPQER
ncbi:MAG: YihY/virulence factor BrkB family protein [Oscillospiraceae bacterium]